MDSDQRLNELLKWSPSYKPHFQYVYSGRIKLMDSIDLVKLANFSCRPGPLRIREDSDE
jgi:hypothetical protein